MELGRELRQDLRFSLRVYRKCPLVTVLALVALALGIGAATGVFSVLNALLLRGLPFAQAAPGECEGYRSWPALSDRLKDEALQLPVCG